MTTIYLSTLGEIKIKIIVIHLGDKLRNNCKVVEDKLEIN